MGTGKLSVKIDQGFLSAHWVLDVPVPSSTAILTSRILLVDRPITKKSRNHRIGRARVIDHR